MLEPDIAIVNIVEDSRYDDQNQRHALIRVEFRVGRNGPFVERFDKDTFSADVRDTKLNAFAAHVRTVPLP